MVSNYVKKGVISHPVKKKYSREQLASLIYIVLSKNVLSLENIDTLFQMQRAHCTAAEAYDYFCDEVENCLPFIFGASPPSATSTRMPPTKSVCCAAPSSPP